MIGEAGRIGVALLDPQVGLVIQQAVQDVDGVAHRGVDNLDAERRVLVGDVGVELHARFLAVLQVNLAGKLAPATGLEVLTVRRRRGAVAPICSEGLVELRVDQFGQPGRVGLVADVPRLQSG